LPSEGVAAVDCHAHVMRRDLPLAPDRHSGPKRDVSVEEFLATMDAHGVSHGVLTAPSFYGTDNSLLLASLATAPERLRGTAIVAPDASTESLEAMDRAGIVGIRLNWFRRDHLDDVQSPAYRGLFDRVRALDWQVEIYLEGAKLASVLPAIRHQGAKVVVDHFGSPDPEKRLACPGFQAVLRGVKSGDTFVKLSAPYRLGGADPQPYVDALLDAGGPQQLVWATDWPFVGFEEKITYAQCVGWIEAWIPDDATRRTVLAETPARLFRFEEKT
jgi:predicted TIM-barrel fold metal-dependent hydrolase